MFYCQKSGKLIGPNVSPVKVVVERRQKTYSNYNREEKVWVESQGWEIVKEILVAPEVAKEMGV